MNWDKAVSKLGGKVNIKDKEASGQGFSLGFYFKPNEKLDVSVAYRSPVDIEAKMGNNGKCLQGSVFYFTIRC